MENLTYEEFINNILEDRGRFNCGEEYHERHHIVPRCMDGGDEEDNLIDLFAKEHFIAHKLLTQENPDNEKLFYAYSCMAFVKSKSTSERYQLTEDEYAELRERWGQTPKSESHKRKISESHIGIRPSEETRKKYSERQIGDKSPRARAVVQYDLDGNYIRQWNCIKDASDALGFPRSGINKCCQRHKWYRQCGGFLWRYADEPLTQEEIIEIKEVMHTVRGVYQDKKSGRWFAKVGNKRIGTFATKEEAIEAKVKAIENKESVNEKITKDYFHNEILRLKKQHIDEEKNTEAFYKSINGLICSLLIEIGYNEGVDIILNTMN